MRSDHRGAGLGGYVLDRLVYAFLTGVVIVGFAPLVGCMLEGPDDPTDQADPTADTVERQQSGLIVATGTDVGTLPGALDVSPGGAAVYTIPLWTPEGRNGLKPSLALSYSSQGGETSVAHGWSLAGGSSSIHRCTPNSRRHSLPQPIYYYDDTKDWCLDGTPLVAVNAGGTEFRTEPDSFAKIVRNVHALGYSEFTVYARDGLIHFYRAPIQGTRTWYYPPYSDEMSPDRSDNFEVYTDDAATYGVLRSETRDRFDNSIFYRHTFKDPAVYPLGVEALLSRIEYVRDATTGYDSRVIELSYVDRPGGARTTYVGGVPFVSSKILRSIDVRVAPAPGATPVSIRYFELGQVASAGTNRTLLTSVKECDGKPPSVNGRTVSCKRPTTFSYEAGSNSFTEVSTDAGNALLQDVDAGYWAGIKPVDLNGDGRDDLVYRAYNSASASYEWYVRYSNGSKLGSRINLGLEVNTAPGEPVVADFAYNDGKPDIAIPSGNTYTTDFEYAYYRNTGSAFSEIAVSGESDAATGGLAFADFGGKGRLMLLRPISSQDSWASRVFVGPTASGLSTELPCRWQPDWQTSGWAAHVVDIHGKGSADFLTLPESYSDRLAAMTLLNQLPEGQNSSAADWYYPQTTLLASKQGDLVKHFFFDMNGDGLPDVFRIRQGDVVPAVIINNGSSFGYPAYDYNFRSSPAKVEVGYGADWRDMVDPGIRLVDYDQDGNQDIMLVDDGAVRDSTSSSTPIRSTIQVLLSRGEGVVAVDTGIPIGRPSQAGQFQPSNSAVKNWRLSHVMDLNGDGLEDIAQVSPSDGSMRVRVRQGKRRDMLTLVRDGMGKKTNITYLPMIDPNVYTPGTSCPSGQQCVKRGQWLVRSFKVDNGDGTNQNEYLFKYEDARIDLQGAGYLGFSRVIREDIAASTRVTDHFDLASTASVPYVDGTAGTVEVYSRLGVPTKRVILTQEPSLTATPTLKREVTTDFTYELVQTSSGKSYYVRPTYANTTDVETKGSVAQTLTQQTKWLTYETTSTAPERKYGILTRVQTSTTSPQGSMLDEWNMTYQYNEGAWILGMPTSRTDYSMVQSTGESRQRSVRMTNDTAKGVLKTLEVEHTSNSSDEYLKLEYTRDSFGNTTVLKRTACTTGRPTACNTPVVRQEGIGYDSFSVHAKTFTNAAGHVTTVDADPGLGVIHSIKDANNATTSLNYDAFGRLRRMSFPGGGGTSISYARANDPANTTSDPRFVTKVTTTYDGGGEVRRTINRVDQEAKTETKNLDATFSFVDRAYNDLGLLKSLTRPATGTTAGAATTWTFDELGRMKTRTRPEDGVNSSGTAVTSVSSSAAYDGLLTTFTDDFGRQRRTTVDGLGRTLKSESLNDAGKWLPVEFTYGPFDVVKLITRKDGATTPQSRVSEITYDVLGRRISFKDPDTGLRQYKYNAFGEVRQEIDAANSTTTYTRDALGRVTQKTDKDGTTTFTWDTATNGKGLLAETLSPFGVKRQFLYDTSGRMYREIWTIRTITYQIDYTFDTNGRLQKVSYPTATGYARLVLKNVFDADSGELSSVVNDTTAKVYWQLNATEADGQIKKETYGNNTFTDYTYSSKTGRVGTMKTTLPGTTATTLRNWSYGYWQDGNLLRRSDLLTSQHERFEYDKLDRIKKWMAGDSAGKAMTGGWTVNYTIDDFGNMTRRQFVAGTSTGGTSQDLTFAMHAGTNRVSTSPWGSYTYDSNGNQTGRPGSEGITYTAFDLPKTITGTRASTFLYDSFGTRAEKKKSDTDFTVYVGGLYEKRKSGSATDHVFYVQARGKTVAQIMQREGGTESVLYLHQERLGSVDAVTDSAGVVVERTKRDPYGNAVTNFNQPTLPTSITASGNRVRLGFTGHEQDDELQLVNMKGRMFDSRLGRFLSPDPLTTHPLRTIAHNRFAYVLGNPARFVDPSGYAAGDIVTCPGGEGKCIEGGTISIPDSESADSFFRSNEYASCTTETSGGVFTRGACTSYTPVSDPCENMSCIPPPEPELQTTIGGTTGAAGEGDGTTGQATVSNTSGIVSGALAHVATTVVNDAIVREEYKSQSKQMKSSEQRTALKAAMRSATSPLGRSIAEAMRPMSQEHSRRGGDFTKSNGPVNRTMAVAGPLGAATLGFSIGFAAAQVSQAPTGAVGRTAAQHVGSFAYAVAVGAAGAEAGALAGAVLGPIGAAAGAVIGGLGGALVGSVVGAQVGDWTYSAF